ncbi:MAG: HDIG domain-containing metalloprotein [Clostridiaceae bacterium]
MNRKETFDEIDKHLLEDSNPSVFLKKLYDEGGIFPDIADLAKLEQEPKYHPEGNVFNHVMLVVDEAARLRDKSDDARALMWAALFHDIGKLTTTKKRKGRWTSYNHDKEGSEKVSNLVKYHMHYLYVEKNLPFADIQGLVKETSVNDLYLLSIADRCGRGGLTESERNNIEISVDEFKRKIKRFKHKQIQ